MHSRKRNYYDVVGLPRNASQSDIDATCIHLAKESQTGQVGNDPIRAETFAQIEEAYETLGDPVKRAPPVPI